MNDNQKSAPDTKPIGLGTIMCTSCCPPSERWWFRWVWPAQPVIALAIFLFERFTST